MSDEARFRIRRSDGRWYLGTVDHQPIFGKQPLAASFTREAGERRMSGLAQGTAESYALVPVEPA